MDRCTQVLSDAKSWGLDTSSAMRVALCTCHTAAGETEEALKILQLYVIHLSPLCISSESAFADCSVILVNRSDCLSVHFRNLTCGQVHQVSD